MLEFDRGKELWHTQRRYCSQRGGACAELCERCERRGGVYLVDGERPPVPACTEEWHGREGCTAILDGCHAGRCDRDELLFVYRGGRFSFASRFQAGGEWREVRLGKWERIVWFNTERGEWRRQRGPHEDARATSPPLPDDSTAPTALGSSPALPGDTGDTTAAASG